MASSSYPVRCTSWRILIWLPEANLCAQALWIRSHFQHAGSAGAEQQIVKAACILMTECVQLMRKSEDHMKVGDLEHPALSCGEPALPSLRLTLHAMSIAAGLVGDGLIITAG